MRVLHFSDTHLGFSDLSKVDPDTGMNQREADFYKAWWHVIGAILEEEPDLVLHAGDLFQSPRPNNRAIRVAFEGIQKVTRAGIPFVVVAGNHSTPRIRQSGSIFESLELFANVYPAYASEYKQFQIGSCAVHCIPHCSLSDELERAYKAVTLNSKAEYQVLVTHGAWRESSGQILGSVGEFNEQFIENPEQRLGLTFDYIALGHYHKHLAVAEHAVYSGSTERTSFNEVGYTSGYVRVDLSAPAWEYVEIPSRPMLALGPIACDDFSVAEVYRAIEQEAQQAPEGALIKLYLQNLPRDTLLGLEAQQIDEFFPTALHVEKVLQPADRADIRHAAASIGSLPDEFARFIVQQTDIAVDREKLAKMGQSFLHAAGGEEDVA